MNNFFEESRPIGRRMSEGVWQDWRRKTEIMKAKILTKPRVKLEPILEQRACLWSASKRRAMAYVYRRWAQQLEVSAAILDRDALPLPPPRLKRLPLQRLKLN